MGAESRPVDPRAARRARRGRAARGRAGHAAVHEVRDGVLRGSRPCRCAACAAGVRAHVLASFAGWQTPGGCCTATPSAARSATPRSSLPACAATARRPAALPVYEEMIVTGAWWDTVDAIAGRTCWRPSRRTFADEARHARWSRGANLWKRRSAILCQLFGKQETDLDCCTRASSRRSPRRSSSCARRSAGRCGNMHASIRAAGWCAMSRP